MNRIQLRLISIILAILIAIGGIYIIRYNFRIVITSTTICKGNMISEQISTSTFRKDKIEKYIFEKENYSVVFVEGDTENEMSYEELGIKLTVSKDSQKIMDERFVLNDHMLKANYNTEYLVENLTFLNEGRNESNFLNIYNLAYDMEYQLGHNITIHLEDYYIKNLKR